MIIVVTVVKHIQFQHLILGKKKIITFPADTTGQYDCDADLSMEVNWWLGAGSTYNSGTLQTTWGAQTNA